MGSILRFKGRIKEARSLLQAVYDVRSFSKGVNSAGETNCELVCQLAAVHCELGNLAKAELLISKKTESNPTSQ